MVGQGGRKELEGSTTSLGVFRDLATHARAWLLHSRGIVLVSLFRKK